MALMEVRDLEKTYQDEDVATRVLKGITLDISEGEFLAIMGPSGSGKSTLLHILGFLEKPSDGSYRSDDRPADKYREQEVAGVGNKNCGPRATSCSLYSTSCRGRPCLRM